jgi:membrane fusion protein (multidrug efflux system)
VSFLRTRSALDQDADAGSRALVWGLLGVAGLWSAWLVLGTVELTEATDQARLEAGRAVHPVDAPAAGTVAAVHVQMGQDVAAGQELLALEDDRAAAALREAQARLAFQEERLASSARELEAEERVSASDERSAASALAEGRARERVAAAEASLAETELAYANRLRPNGLVSELDLLRRAGEAERKRAALEGARDAVRTLEAEKQARARRAAGRLEHLKEERAAAGEEIAALRSRIGLMRRELEQRVVRAPVGGRIGRLAALRPGSVVAEGARIAEVVPAGAVHAVGFFPLDSLGRLRAGQPARLRLVAYPWTQYGWLRARVRSVGTEADEGRIRVELDVQEPLPDGVVAVHGLVGSLTVEVDRVAPLALALRSAGGRARGGL